MASNLIVIPARLKATRLPDKPLADIAGEPMIVHVWRRAVEAKCGPVVVVADDEAICEAVRLAGGEALMTRPDHVSGSDRIFEAVSRLDPEGEIATIVNLQGDLPTLDPKLVRACLEALDDDAAEIGTIAAEITREEERTDPNVVKVVGSPLDRRTLARALFHQGHGALRRRPALSPYRHLCIPASGAWPLRVPASIAAREQGEARAAKGARSWHAHPRRPR